MFRKLFFALTGMMLVASPLSANESTIQQGEKKMVVQMEDYQAVKETVNKYLEAGKKGDSSIAKPAFYKDAVIYSSDKGVISGGSISSLYDYFDGNPPATDLKADIVSIEIVGTIAVAKVESDNWHGARYTDMFFLVKENDGWKIITKVFHTH